MTWLTDWHREQLARWLYFANEAEAGAPTWEELCRQVDYFDWPATTVEHYRAVAKGVETMLLSWITLAPEALDGAAGSEGRAHVLGCARAGFDPESGTYCCDNYAIWFVWSES